MESQTFDLRSLEHLPDETAGEIVRATRHGAVTLLLVPGTQPARKLATLCGGLLREARPGVWRLAA